MLRPARRRVRALLDRRALARAALREDALRQRPARCGCTRGRGWSPATTGYRARGHGDARLPAPRDAARPRAGSSPRRTRTARASRGKFFVWSWDELVDARRASRSPRAFGARARGQLGGHERAVAPDALARRSRRSTGCRADELTPSVEDARPSCSRSASGASGPATDDKVLAVVERPGDRARSPRRAERSASRAYVRGGRRGAPSSCWTHLRDERGRLLRSWRDGRRRRAGRSPTTTPSMASACLTLYETTFEVRWFEEARELADDAAPAVPRRGARRVLPDGGRRRGTGGPAEGPVRQRGAVRELRRGRRAAAAGAVHRRRGYERAGVSALRLSATRWRAPDRVRPRALRARPLRRPANEVAIVGDPRSDDTRPSSPRSSGAVTARTSSSPSPPRRRARRAAVPLLRDRDAMDDAPTAYVCERFACKLPVTTTPRRYALSWMGEPILGACLKLGDPAPSSAA